MRIELRNVQHNERLSEETNCFSADVFVNGERIGEVSNRGQGGPDDFYGDHEKWRELEEWVRENIPPYTGYDGKPWKHSMETYIGQLLNEHLIRKHALSLLHYNLLFTRPDKPGLFKFKLNRGIKKTDLLDHVRQSYPQYTFLDDLPEEEAIQIILAS